LIENDLIESDLIESDERLETRGRILTKNFAVAKKLLILRRGY